MYKINFNLKNSYGIILNLLEFSSPKLFRVVLNVILKSSQVQGKESNRIKKIIKIIQIKLHFLRLNKFDKKLVWLNFEL